MFEVGDLLRFSEEGLRLWWGGSDPPERYRQRYGKWRWKVIQVTDEIVKGNPVLRVERTDIASHPRGLWNAKFFEKVEQ